MMKVEFALGYYDPKEHSYGMVFGPTEDILEIKHRGPGVAELYEGRFPRIILLKEDEYIPLYEWRKGGWVGIRPDKWCWREPNSDMAFGEFDSYEEALKDAKDTFWNPETHEYQPNSVMIGSVKWADPVEYIQDDLEEMLELMDEKAYENEFSFWDDPIFIAREGAQTELTRILKKWAEDYLKPECWRTSNEEEIELE